MQLRLCNIKEFYAIQTNDFNVKFTTVGPLKIA